ncbi:MAG: hypothetical protein M1820_008679, partial [Bogoriella megaspora]
RQCQLTPGQGPGLGQYPLHVQTTDVKESPVDRHRIGMKSVPETAVNIAEETSIAEIQ